MRYLLCDCSNLDIILFALHKLNYKLKNFCISVFLLPLHTPTKILIDQKEKVYYILSRTNDAYSIVGDDSVTILYDAAMVLNKLGAKDILNNGTSQPFDLSKIDYSNIKNRFDKIFNNTLDKDSYQSNSKNIDLYKTEFIPGRIVLLEIRGMRHFGFILSSGNIAYANDKGEIKGYLSGNSTIPDTANDKGIDILKILVPTESYFQLKDYNKMQVAWQKSEKKTTVKKTIAEIEKELGLAPGTLEIN